MKFNSGTDSIIDEIDALCDSDINSYPLADKTRRVNIGLEGIVGEILAADGTWQWDDTNQSDFPIATADMVDGQQDYSFNDDFLRVLRVEVLDSEGNFQLLQPRDESEVTVALSEQDETNGMPTHYDKLGRSIFLYPAPATADVTATNGLKVYYQRSSFLFTTADTTRVPGFPSLYHSILAYMAAIPYCMTYKKDRVANYERVVEKMTEDIIQFYSKRSKDVRPIIKNKPIYHR